jgi:hypothetical protein
MAFCSSFFLQSLLLTRDATNRNAKIAIPMGRKMKDVIKPITPTIQQEGFAFQYPGPVSKKNGHVVIYDTGVGGEDVVTWDDLATAKAAPQDSQKAAVATASVPHLVQNAIFVAPFVVSLILG